MALGHDPPPAAVTRLRGRGLPPPPPAADRRPLLRENPAAAAGSRRAGQLERLQQENAELRGRLEVLGDGAGAGLSQEAAKQISGQWPARAPPCVKYWNSAVLL